MEANDVFMAFPQPQHAVTFLRRKQRFVAEVELADGTQQLVYCANSGAMAGQLSSGIRALVWDSEDLTRKRRFTWRAVETNGLWVGTDTHLANRIVEQALRMRLIPALEGYVTIMREPIVEQGVRVDFVISGPLGECFVEVKSTNIVEKGVARYPDSPTPRGVKHLESLARKAAKGERAVLLFLIQRCDAVSFEISAAVDRSYSSAFEVAVALGVEVIVMAVPVHPEGFGKPCFLPRIGASSEVMNDATTMLNIKSRRAATERTKI